MPHRSFIIFFFILFSAQAHSIMFDNKLIFEDIDGLYRIDLLAPVNVINHQIESKLQSGDSLSLLHYRYAIGTELISLRGFAGFDNCKDRKLIVGTLFNPSPLLQS